MAKKQTYTNKIGLSEATPTDDSAWIWAQSCTLASHGFTILQGAELAPDMIFSGHLMVDKALAQKEVEGKAREGVRGEQKLPPCIVKSMEASSIKIINKAL